MSSIKDDIIKALLTANGEAVSGQQLADRLGVSRTAIWKQMQGLQEEGYVFETVKKKGYILKETPEMLTVGEIMTYLKSKRFGQSIYIYDVVESTQVNAHELARQGVPDGTVVIAEDQTAGKGRMARQWQSKKGKGIWMTVIVRPDVPPHMASQFTLVAAVAVIHAMKEMFRHFTPEIKWPNDILINGKKCTGILTEMQAEADRVQALLIGIGLNVNHDTQDFPEEIQPIATSLAMEEGEFINRAELIANVLYYLETYTDQYVREGFSQLKEMWEEASCTIGQCVKVTTLREEFTGIATGINKDGVLQVKVDNGEVRPIYSGDIEIVH